MQIDDRLITYLEDLSHLALSPSEKTRLTGDLGKILDGMAQLMELNTADTPEYSLSFKAVNVFLDDEPRPSFDRELLLKNTPHRNAEMIIAPKTIE